MSGGISLLVVLVDGMRLENAKLTISILLFDTLFIVITFTTTIPSEDRLEDECRREKKKLNDLHVVVVCGFGIL
jgi:hypothetical protein